MSFGQTVGRLEHLASEQVVSGHHVHNFHPLGVSDTMLFQETATERAIKSFKLLDVNGDGELNEDEFVEGCMRDKTLSDLLNAGNLSGP